MIIKNPLFTEEIPAKGSSKGHVRFTLNGKKPEDVALVGFCANVTASLLFERLQAQGTNLIINLSGDGARLDVLARYENDGLNLLWTPKTAEASHLADVQERIKNKTFTLAQQKEKEPAPSIVETAVKTESEPTAAALPSMPTTYSPPNDKLAVSEEEESFLIKQLHRIP